MLLSLVAFLFNSFMQLMLLYPVISCLLIDIPEFLEFKKEDKKEKEK